MKLLKQITQHSHNFLWGEDLGTAPMLRRWFLLPLRTLYAVGRDIGEGQITLRAMSLVYTTLLSLVPLLALAFSVLKGFGVQNQVRPALLALLAPLGEQGVEITDQVIGFVNNIQVGVLGALGLGLLIYTVITLLQKIEHAFNFVWRVKSARPLSQRFSQYLSVLMIGPLLIFSAMGVTAAFFGSSTVQGLIAIEPLGALVKLVAALLPFLLVIAGFTFVYVLMPNTRVRLGSALVGASVAGVLWQTLGWSLAAFIAGSTRYTAIYAGFAIVIFSMIWLYLNWLIVLVGASIACYHQYPALLATPRREFRLSNRVKEKIALLIATFIGRNYYTNAPAWSLESLAGRLGVPVITVESVIMAIQRAGYITETADVPPRYLPARSFETITVKELLDTLRSAEEEPGLNAEILPHEAEVEILLARLDEAADASLRGRSLRDLAMASVPPPTEKRAAAHEGVSD
ncbi:MAG: YihY/virulence factor BrkB family protein [Sulfuricaulis sp.]|uniref:YihY/virulence factor BrkB family protein n=1 Tax=Sulfuricaulis sp. TaxID=2003553 RepID=UPI0025D1000F|nr:YihY/virulence factor BrkB family protein [Sulfuricaulis sp.]MCR4345978.1 YihY/virulence factor BrkB family protein [Sulfuricaulis sp.]